MVIRSVSASIAPEHRPTFSGMPTDDSSRSTDLSKQGILGRVVRRRRLRSLLLAGAGAAILIGSSGCTFTNSAIRQIRRAEQLNEFMLAHRNSAFAARAWYREKDCYRNQSNLADFKAGFIAGYIEVADGGTGCTPSTAPSSYWGWKYQSPGGHAAVGAWFAGYPMGAKAAEQDGLGRYAEIQITPNRQSPNDAKASEATGPDGSPISFGPDGKPTIEEVIVPGSEQVVPSPFETELNPPMEMLDPPQPGGVEPIREGDASAFPWLEDSASLETPANEFQPRQNDPDQPSYTYGTVPTIAARESNQALVESGRPADDAPLVPRDDVMTYSLNDQDSSSDAELGDDAIEGIFGSIEMPNDLSLSAPQTPSSQSSLTDSKETEAEIETARVMEDDIPFKFE